MKLFLKGHGYQYAAEQILLMMFPEERPEYPEQDSGEEPAAALSLSMGAVYATARTQIRFNGKQAAGSARVLREKLAGKLETDRWLQRILKLSFYKAAIQITGKKPAWGALTGIRPGKIATAYLESGCSAGKAARQMQKEYFL